MHLQTPTWDKVALCVAMAILFVLEMIGVFGKKDDLWTITYVIRTYMPLPMQFMVYGWVGGHFFVQTFLKGK